MSPEEIEAIAQRPTYCKTDGEAVTLSRAERDALVAMARRYAWLRDATDSQRLAAERWMACYGPDRLDAAIDAKIKEMK
ncbi:hypothetical protein [Achromobacter sp. NFACC18-2]|uniref:hypothetical protein n=1 Tax=Achromobacter sp. NFACC18-2 TaxID=1564112 RepID=UPI0008CAEA2E|nr:hypothetical protein [Achromobacter sp. NFACC18-2]SEK09522.1 hypothetical protein SAMN03159494_05184 [Achromobacter sp. NFACC18-2]